MRGLLLLEKKNYLIIMKSDKIEITYQVFDNINELSDSEAFILKKAIDITGNAYAPYSKFNVGAAARLVNGEIITGTNQENASYPVGLCAERTLLASASVVYPGVAIETMAISYKNQNGNSDHPIAPCGMCRQYIQEYELRFNKPIRLILSGEKGRILVFEKASYLLPFGFTGDELNKS